MTNQTNVNSDNSKTSKSFFYSFFEKCSVQIISFVISVILARLLMPEAYGVVALVTIFITFADVFVTYGFGNSLIVKKGAKTVDYSSCLYASLVFAAILYSAIYFLAPVVEGIFGYEEYNLTLIIRVMALRLPVASFHSIQQAYISKNMRFGRSFLAGFIASIISGVAGIVMAYNGFGIWALVTQYLSQAVLNAILIFFLVSWRPTFEFSIKSVGESLSFGWKVLVAGFLDTLYNEIRSLLIAKKYTSADLGYYNKGDSFPKLLVGNVNVPICTVVFPLLANHNDDTGKVKEIARTTLQVTSFVLFPLLVGLAAVAEPMVVVLLGDKWIASAQYITILSLGYMFWPISSIGRNIMKAMKRSDILLCVDIIQKIIGVTIIVVSIYFGIFWVVVGASLYNLISVIVNIIPLSRISEYKFWEQLADIIPNLLMSLIMGASVYMIQFLPMPAVLCLIVQIAAGIAVYFILSVVTRSKCLSFCLSYAKNIFRKKVV